MTDEHANNQEVDLDHILSDDYEAPESDVLADQDLEGADPLDILTPEEKEMYEAIQQKVMGQDHIIEFFNQLEQKPSQEEIDEWKAQVGEIYFAMISESEHFVFRAIKRKEWRDLIKRLEQVKDPMKQDEAIVMKGVLYPKLDTFNVNMLSAGTINTMKELIMQASNFLPPEYALQLVRKL